MYKLRIYKLSGADKGNLDHEEMFGTKGQMDRRYLVDSEWKRLEGY